MSKGQNHLLDLQEHCSRLHQILGSPEFIFEHYRQVSTRDGETLDWGNASEWLQLASSIDWVEVNTSRCDASVMYCESAWEFESARSKLLTRFATQLTVFIYVWGALETIVRVIDPPPIPKSIKPYSSLIDEAIWYLKNTYEPAPPPSFYDDMIANLWHIMERLSDYHHISQDRKLQSHVGVSGVGVDIVRKIRNRLAHGTLKMPMPEDWCLPRLAESGDITEPLDVELITLGTRIVLLTIQMLLMSYFKDVQFQVGWLLDYWKVSTCDGDIHTLLRMLHVQDLQVDES